MGVTKSTKGAVGSKKLFGAYVAVYIGFGDVIHLSADNIIKNQKYKYFIGPNEY